MDINFKLHMNELTIHQEAEKKLLESARTLMERRVKELFHDDRFHHPALKTNHPDEGMAVKIVDKAITDVVLDPKWENFIKHRFEEVYQAELEQAIQRAAKHKAGKAAFADVQKKST